MHRTAEYGIAAHWKYKEDPSGKNTGDSEEAKLTWLRQILEWQRDMSDNREFMSLLKNDLDLFSESVYCFTRPGMLKIYQTVQHPLILLTVFTVRWGIRWLAPEPMAGL